MVEQKGNQKKETFVHSAVNNSVSVKDHEVLTLAKCPPPEFHIMDGFINHTFYVLVKVVGYDIAMNWSKQFSLVPKDYQK